MLERLRQSVGPTKLRELHLGDDLATLRLTPHAGAVRVAVHARPRARKSAISGVRDGALLVNVAATPVDGAANEELIATISKVLKVPVRDVELLRGEAARTKLVEVRGLTVDEVRARFIAALDPGYAAKNRR